MTETDLIPLFKVLSTHGLKGDLRVALLTLNQDLLSHIQKLYLKNKEEVPLVIKSIQKGPGFNIFLLSLEEIDFERAKGLLNKILYLKPSDLPELKEEEFYYYQLEGLKIVDRKDKFWGEVSGVMPLGEYDLLLIKTPEGKEFYLPLVDEYVEEVNIKEKIILVKEIEALVESQR